MDIRKIVIKGLFGTIDHEIELSDSISILMGENGVGKTAILNIVKDIFENDFDTLLSYRFNTIKVCLKSKRSGCIEYFHEDGSIHVSSSSKNNQDFIIGADDIDFDVPPYMRQVSHNRWFDIHSRVYYTTDELRDFTERDIIRISEGKIKEWYLDLIKATRVKMIGTQRLYQFSNFGRSKDIMKINSFSKDFVKYISSELSNAGKQSAELDRTFPTRLVRQLKGNKNYKSAELIQDLEQLETLRSTLSEVGFLDKIDINIEGILGEKTNNRVLMNVIKLYISDSQEKLEKYKTAADKVSLFLRIINNRLKAKRLSIDTEKGFIVNSLKNTDKDSIDIDQLSSGEQNEIVLFYDLIFNCDKCSLVLIDEPEISLHLEWLQQMLGDFKDIVNLNGMKMLIATHSPDFVGDNYDLVQNLTYE